MKEASQRGQMIVMVGVMLTVLLAAAGMMIDLGYIYAMRAKLKNAADSAALAGAWRFPDASGAQTIAASYANTNEPYTTITPAASSQPNDYSLLTVHVTKSVPHHFMQVIGLKNTMVAGSAVSGLYQTQINNFGAPNILPIGVPDTALQGTPTCILWGPNNQCNDLSPSGGGSLGSQFKGLVDLSTCSENADATQGNDCASNPFDSATNYGNKPGNINGWIGNGCDCSIGLGNDMALYNGNLGSNVSSPMSAACYAQGLSDSGGSYGLFVVLVYSQIFPPANNPSINIVGFAQYKVYCSQIFTSSAVGTFVMLVTSATPSGTLVRNNYTGTATVGLYR